MDIIRRLDDRAILMVIVSELLDRGIAPEEIDVRLSQIAPVDLDLLQSCFDEIGVAAEPEERRAA